jgi:hypothetical protein
MKVILKGLGVVAKVMIFGGIIALNFILDCIGLLIGAITNG